MSVNKSKSSKVSKKDEKPAIDVTKHILVPKHRILNKKDVDKLLKFYSISVHQLPLIKANDPIAKAIHAEAGDIIEIIRDGPTKKYPFYRRVVE